MKLSSSLSTYAVVLSGFLAHAAAKLETLPSDAVLIYPTVKVNKNRELTLGFNHGEWHSAYGIIHNMRLNLTYPNGTNAVVTRRSDSLQFRCLTPSWLPVHLKDVWVNETGLYTAVWNLTYGTSTEPDQLNDTSDFCGPEPYLFETSIMNATFEVADLGNISNPIETHTTQLSPAPTGQIWVRVWPSHPPESKSISWDGILLLALAALFVMGVFGEYITLACIRYFRPKRAHPPLSTLASD